MSDSAAEGPTVDLAAALFDQFVSRVEAGEPLTIDAFCASHRAHESELRALIEFWQQARAGVETKALEAQNGVDETHEELLARYQDRKEFFARRYRILGDIKMGGMGAILRAEDLDVGREVAIKIIRDQRAVLAGKRSARVPPKVLARFLNEAKITGQLEHPAIVPVHEIGVDDQGRAFFTMKLVRGRELGEVFDLTRDPKSGWTQTRALDLLLRVCEALAYAHDKGVVHRDLKPANIMVGGVGEVYVMDWGIAKKAMLPGVLTDEPAESPTERRLDTNLSEDGKALGTPSYMPPEQARGDRQSMGPQSDVYAVGAMLYHLLAGRPPFQRQGESSTPTMIRDRLLGWELDSLPNEGVPAELQSICLKAMAPEPMARYDDMRELAADLRAYLEGRVVHAHQVGRWAELTKWVTRNKAVCALAGTTGAAVLLGLSAFAWSQAQARRRIELESDVYRVPYLLAEARDKLWPSSTAIVPEMQRWMADANNVLSRSSEHTAMAAEVGREAPLRKTAHNLNAGFAELTDACKDMRERIDLSTYVDRRHVATDVDVWSRAIADIADTEHSPCYGGLRISAQEGLVPAGKDPCSGLWEFADLRTGTPAIRGSDGELRRNGDSSVTFVLIPGGTYWMGSQNNDPMGINYDPQSNAIEHPVHPVTVKPFFLSKYEMTQGQYIRVTNANPSVFRVGVVVDGREISMSNPVEGVTWTECVSALKRIDFRLPTEDEWEYGARAGSSTAWWFGQTPAGLDNVANVADQIALQFEVRKEVDIVLNDGFGHHAPVGSFAPNAFGLYDTIGNVAEWVLDCYRDNYSRPLHNYDAGAPCLMRVSRGGSYFFSSEQGRSAWRDDYLAEGRNGTLGFRPARDIR